MSTALCQLLYVDCSMSTALCQLLYVDCSMSTALCQLLYVNCSMSSAQCSMSTAQCSMSTAQCSMSTAQCSMSTALFRDLPGHRICDFTDGLAANRKPLSRRMKKSRPYTMNNIIKLTSLYFVGVVIKSTKVLFLFRGAQIGDDAFLHLIYRPLVVSSRVWF